MSRTVAGLDYDQRLSVSGAGWHSTVSGLSLEGGGRTQRRSHSDLSSALDDNYDTAQRPADVGLP
jgi:hypothetical protein